MRNKLLISFLFRFVGIVLLETFLHAVFSILLYIIQYNWESLFIVSENTGDSFFNRILDTALYILILRVLFIELLIKFGVYFTIKRKIWFLALNLISIVLFSFIVDVIYHEELYYKEFLHPIWGWRYHILIAVFFTSILKLIFEKKFVLNESTGNDFEHELIDQN